MEILLNGLQFPEGPVFAPDGSLWLVELKGGNLVRFFNGTAARFAVGGQPNGIAIDRKNNIWFCDAGEKSIRVMDAKTKKVKTVVSIVENEPLNKPNDLAFDRVGNLVFTCPGDSRKEPGGYVCVLTKSGEVKKIAEHKYFPNGLAFSKDGSELIVAETYRHRLWKGKWDAEKAEWLGAEVWCDIGGPNGPGGPDGMTFDEEGNLYTAVYGTGEIRVADKHGMIINRIQLPGKNPTNCTFHLTDKKTLIVTEAEKGQLLSVTIK